MHSVNPLIPGLLAMRGLVAVVGFRSGRPGSAPLSGRRRGLADKVTRCRLRVGKAFKLWCELPLLELLPSVDFLMPNEV